MKTCVRPNQAIMEVLRECHDEVLQEIQQEASKVPEGDTVSITDPYAASISINSNLLIAQFCASRESYKEINIQELQRVILKNKDALFSYDISTETVSMKVTAGTGAEGEAGEGGDTEETKTVTFTRHNYVVKYAGDTYFADRVFHLTDKQKELAEGYEENLELFFGSSISGVATTNVSKEVLAYRSAVERIAAKYGMAQYTELILAVMMQESGGRVKDVMQASESSFNQKYPHAPGSIIDPEYSIECGVQALKYVLDKAGCTSPADLDRIKLALQGYNFGSGYIDWAMECDGGYTKENAAAFSDMMCARPGWNYSVYGDKEYVDHVLRYYTITSTGGTYPANGMQIPPLPADGLWKYPLWRRLYRFQRVRSHQLCHGGKLSDRDCHYPHRRCCLVRGFLLYAWCGNLLVLLCGCSRPFRMWVSHPDQ